MFKKAQINLTIVYSVLFLTMFALLSFGIYSWMDQSFGEGYISQVEQKQNDRADMLLSSKNAHIVTIAGDVAMDKLLSVLIILNAGLVFIVPFIAWFLAKQTLSPIQSMYEIQKQFVSDASHELRTPLSIMSGEIEVALRKERKTGEYKKLVESNKEEIDRLSVLVQNLLFFARGDQKLGMVDQVDITDIVSSSVARYYQMAKGKNIDIVFEPLKEQPMISGNSTMLRQCFDNLIENAVKYSPGKSNIKVLFTSSKSMISVHIIDSGIGIPKTLHKKIFDRFYRADSARSSNGYGLGLAICKRIIEFHKGYIFAISNEGRGSTFTVQFHTVNS